MRQAHLVCGSWVFDASSEAACVWLVFKDLKSRVISIGDKTAMPSASAGAAASAKGNESSAAAATGPVVLAAGCQ